MSSFKTQLAADAKHFEEQASKVLTPANLAALGTALVDLIGTAQKVTGAIVANEVALLADGAATATDSVSLAGAVISGNLPVAIAAFVRLLSDAGADAALIKKVVAAA